MGNQIKLSPKEAATAFEQSQANLKSYLDAVDDLGATVKSIHEAVFSDPINAALVIVSKVLTNAGDAVNSGVSAFHTAFGEVASAWKSSDFAAGSAPSFAKPAFAGVIVSSKAPEHLEVETGKIDQLIEELTSKHTVMRGKFEDIEQTIANSKSWYIGDGADKTRNTFATKVSPLKDDVAKAVTDLKNALEAEKANLLAKSSGRFVE